MPTAELEKVKDENLEVDFAKLSPEEGLDVLSTSENGLSKYESYRRLQAYGQNKIEHVKKKSKLQVFFSNFKSPLIYILLISAAFALLIGNVIDAFVIFMVVAINAVVGYLQERKAEKEITSLRKMTTSYVNIIRGGNRERIETQNLVLGDIVFLEEGDKIPADGRLIEVNNLLINESSLTGESRLIEKTIENQTKEDVTSDNMVYQGTTVAEGRGTFFVTATALETRFGKITFLAEETQTKTPLQKKMEILSREIGAVVLIVSVLIVAVGVLKGESFIYMTQVAVSLAVSAIPEGLPIAITVILVLGAKRMAKRKAIVRNMMAVETLGTTTVIATDKTGTLTHNTLKVVEMFAGRKTIKREAGKFDTYGEKLDHDFEKMLYSAAICSNAQVNDITEEITGESTDVAVMEAAVTFGFIKKAQERLDEIPFTSGSKKMSVLVEAYGGCSLYVKGAPEEIIKNCEKVYKDGKVSALKKKELKLINASVADMTKRGLRVIAVCYKDTNEIKKISPKTSNNLVLLGLIGLEDTYREGVFDAIEKCKTAGIKIMMLTGDHLQTALNIAKSLNIYGPDKKALLGQDVQTQKVSNIHLSQVAVFARILPEHKYKIIEMLKEDGEIVAMTGDGVNDVPALKKADIGIAMGISGTEAAKEAADIVLTDDNFSTIVSAVEEGRTIFENIRKTLTYIFSTSLGEVLTVVGSLFLGIPLPITPLQILWINLITDTSATIPLGMEEKEESHLQKPPRHPRENIISMIMVRRSLLVGVYMAAFAIILFSLNLHKGEDYARTITFLFLSISQWVNAFNCRSEKRSIFTFNPFSNQALLLGIALSFIGQVIVMYILPFNLFSFEKVGLNDWILALGISLGLVLLVEADKVFIRILKKK